MTDGRYLIAHDVPLNLTADGADAFATAFRHQLRRQRHTADTANLEAGELPLVPNLVSAPGNR